MWGPLGNSSGLFSIVDIGSTILASLDSGEQCLYDFWPSLAHLMLMLVCILDSH